MRPVSEDVVKERVNELNRNPPAVPLRLTVHHDTVVFLSPLPPGWFGTLIGLRWNGVIGAFIPLCCSFGEIFRVIWPSSICCVYQDCRRKGKNKFDTTKVCFFPGNGGWDFFFKNGEPSLMPLRWSTEFLCQVTRPGLSKKQKPGFVYLPVNPIL